jgi:hypothetical protein
MICIAITTLNENPNVILCGGSIMRLIKLNPFKNSLLERNDKQPYQFEEDTRN